MKKAAWPDTCSEGRNYLIGETELLGGGASTLTLATTLATGSYMSYTTEPGMRPRELPDISIACIFSLPNLVTSRNSRCLTAYLSSLIKLK